MENSMEFIPWNSMEKYYEKIHQMFMKNSMEFH
jgi:hypothetical protein